LEIDYTTTVSSGTKDNYAVHVVANKSGKRNIYAGYFEAKGTNTSDSTTGIYARTTGKAFENFGIKGEAVGQTTSGSNYGGYFWAGGAPTNYGIYTKIMPGSNGWSLWSDNGNIMFKDGHIQNKQTNAPNISLTAYSCGATVSVTCSNCTDVKGTPQVSWGSGLSIGCTITIVVGFAQSYSAIPVVVATLSDPPSGWNGSVYVANVWMGGFEIKVLFPSGFSGNGSIKINYFVIE